ncbi:hypothetical protein [Gordonia sp. (in: high G+C Gram-positive bacteria)]|uniref:hypothetical protein n=1 Tax=unclassified Gordonia (in: high G+C Gram-positive bacteria) TaxID=2657482 RepID=UPI002615EF85|nr:hypothetical protein [Gordonia sp. (in: high G+C Gram-positive bacteria)]
MNPIEAFLALLRLWRDRGAVAFDDDEVAAPHRALRDFDLDAFGATAQALRTQSAVLDDSLTRLDAVVAETPLGWTGTGALAAQHAAARLAADLLPTAEAVGRYARTVSTAHEILGEVFADYRSTMEQVTGPVAAGTGPAAVRDELTARLDLAEAAGRATSRAVDESIAALGGEWGSDGELVLAGER